MSEINLNVDVGQTKTLTFNTKDKYNSEDIVFNIETTGTLKAAAGTNINSVGTPTVGVSTTGDTTTLTFNYLKGTTGAQGYQGKSGVDGVQGFQGLQGIKGTDGTRGVQGFQGLQGIKGTDGTRGVQGFQGLQGIKGTDGTRGVQGFQGLQGIKGIDGSRGVQGYQGIKGTDGSRGVQGFQGIKGTDGSRGVQGCQGYAGLQGATGLQGKNGTNGTNGINGVQGYTGLQGATGLQGKNGTNGTNGVRGAQGYQGKSGVDGTNGTNGTNFVGCFNSSYSLYERNQYTAGTTYTFNKSDFNFLNVPLSQGDTILVIYSLEYNNVTYVEHCYIRLTRFRENETTFMGVVWKWFKLSDGIDGVQGYQGFQGISGTNGTSGAQGYRGYQGIQGKQGLQGISGALATNHWYLDKANPEVTNNGSSILIQLDTINDSIFAKLSNLTNGPLNGRNFIVDLADSDGSAMINNLFGDFSKYNVPNHVRYHFYIRNISKRERPVKIHWNSEFYTNVSHRPGWQPQIVLGYGECCKIEFVKFDQIYSWVDVELEDLIYDASTSAASENNEDNATSQIQAYCDNNKLSYTLNKETHDIQFNLIDVIADICSKLK
jgi:hypothetical protein